MLKLFNTSGRKAERFRPDADGAVTIFTCGPSVYQPAHIGNYRTFLYEDILVRYLEYSGFEVVRGMAVTDIEDKAVREAELRNTTVRELTDRNIKRFVDEMGLLGMKTPRFMPRASECVDESVMIIRQLMSKKIAYRHGKNIYFDPLKFPGFGRLFGLDMSRWPKKKRRFHKDTYPGIQWNYGDFILWHGCELSEKACWETTVGKGRPSWNVQDPSMVMRHFPGALSIFCGGIDNLYRHHDYSLAIMESVRKGPMARFWMHGAHLYVDNRKMSKSKGNILYPWMLTRKGYTPQEIRFFLMYGHYRAKLNYSDASMKAAAGKLREIRRLVSAIKKKAGSAGPVESEISRKIRDSFVMNMDNDMAVKTAFDEISRILNETGMQELSSGRAAGIARILREADEVLKVLF